MRIYSYMDQKKHWHLALTCNPIGFHFAVTSGNLKTVQENFCKDLREACDFVIYYFNNVLLG